MSIMPLIGEHPYPPEAVPRCVWGGLEVGNKRLFEGLFDDPRAIVAFGPLQVTTRESNPRNPEIALSAPVHMLNGDKRTAVIVIDLHTFLTMSRQIEQNYGEYTCFARPATGIAAT